MTPDAMTPHNVLIIDDERLVRWALRERLAHDAARVMEAGSGEEALRLLDGQADNGVPMVVLLDLKLPDMDGLDLLPQLLSRRPKLRVIVLSAHATRDVAEAACRSGALRVEGKPFDLDDVADWVNAAARPAEPKSP